MFKGKITFEPCVLPEFKVERALAVDQFRAQDFGIGDNGWIANDLTMLARATSMSQAQAILQRLVQRDAQKSNIPAGTKLKDAYNYVRPRYCQSELEVAQFAEALAQFEVSQAETARAAFPLEDASKDDGSVSTQPASPAPASTE